MTARLLDRHVFYIGILQKYITIRQIIRFLEDEAVENAKYDPHGYEYITWGELESYFKMLRKVPVQAYVVETGHPTQ